MIYQKCSKCNSEWNAIKIVKDCPFCGNPFEIKKSDFKDVNEAFAYIFSTHGIDVIKQKGVFVSLLADYAPALEKERRVVRMALDAGIYGELLIVSTTDVSAQNAVRAKAVSKLNNEYMLDHSWAEQVVNWLVSQLNWSTSGNDNARNIAPSKIECIVPPPTKTTVNSSSVNVQSYNGKLKVGDRVEFGSYPFDDKRTWKKIGWEILDIKNDKALLWAEFCVDAYPYHRVRKRCDWRDCSLRDWLRDRFTVDAFQNDERLALCEGDVLSSKNPKCGQNGGPATRDRVFILGNEDFEQYGITEARLKTFASPYAKNQGVFCSAESDAFYWVRTPGSSEETQMFIGKAGHKDESGSYIDLKSRGIRPAIWVDYKMLNNITCK